MSKRPALKTTNDFYWLSSSYAGSGEKEKALAALHKSLDLSFGDLPAINANPAFDSLRNDARFRQLLLRFSK